jgi:hypothetical protein
VPERRHRIGFLTLRHAVLIEPDVLSRRALLEEQQVGTDGGIGLEYRIGQADDGVKVALLHQMLLEPCFNALTEQRAIGKHHSGAAIGFEQAHNQREEQIGSFLCAEGREVVLDAVFLVGSPATEWSMPP